MRWRCCWAGVPRPRWCAPERSGRGSRGIFEADEKGLPEGIEAEDGELIIEREILSNGKSRAFAGGRPVTAALLKELARTLGDIHGQHDQQQLFSGGVQREMLDGFAEAGELLTEVASFYTRWNAATAELAELDRTAQEKLRQADLWSFQRNEIEAVNPQPGEDVQLENERRVLRNVGAPARDHAGAAYSALYTKTQESVAAQLHTVIKRLEELGRMSMKACGKWWRRWSRREHCRRRKRLARWVIT